MEESKKSKKKSKIANPEKKKDKKIKKSKEEKEEEKLLKKKTKKSKSEPTGPEDENTKKKHETIFKTPIKLKSKKSKNKSKNPEELSEIKIVAEPASQKNLQPENVSSSKNTEEKPKKKGAISAIRKSMRRKKNKIEKCNEIGNNKETQITQMSNAVISNEEVTVLDETPHAEGESQNPLTFRESAIDVPPAEIGGTNDLLKKSTRKEISIHEKSESIDKATVTLREDNTKITAPAPVIKDKDVINQSKVTF